MRDEEEAVGRRKGKEKVEESTETPIFNVGDSDDEGEYKDEVKLP